MAHFPQPSPATRKIWPWLALAGTFTAIAGVIVLVFLLNKDSDSPSTLFETRLQLAYNTCEAGNLADEDHTLVIDMAGEEYGTGDASFSDVSCVLTELSAPESVIARMNSTRALDGMQSATWDGFEASWTYHPDDGLDLIITQTN